MKSLFILFAFLLAGCNSSNESAPVAGRPVQPQLATPSAEQLNPRIEQSTAQTGVGVEKDTVQLTEDEFDLLKFVVCNYTIGGFITTTPPDQWTRRGGWKRLPESFHQQVEAEGGSVRPASEVFLVNGKLTVPEAGGMNLSPTLTILEIIEWVSKNEAVVRISRKQSGWCGTGSEPWKLTLEKIDGNWLVRDIELR
jgi:hypothetical protein